VSVKWYIERGTLLGFVLAFALLSVAGVVSYRSLRQHEETTRWLIHTHDVLFNLESGFVDLLNIQTGIRGFVLTGEPRYLEPYERSLPQIPRQLERLRFLTADNPRHQKRLDRLDVLVPEFLAYMKLRLETRRQMGFAAAVEQVATGKGKKLMDDIRVVFAEMGEEERQLLRVRTQAAGASTRQAMLVFSVSSLLAGLFFGFCLYLIRRQIRRIQLAEVKARDARVFAESIVDTMREPLLVLAGDFRVIAANRSFYQHFHLTSANTENRFLYELAEGKWNIPELCGRLGQVIPGDGSFDDFEVTAEFPPIGQRVLMLNARKLYREGNNTHRILLAIEDVTERKRVECTLAALLEAAPDSVVVTDNKGYIVRINAQTEKLFGYSRDELIGQRVETLIPERLRERHLAHWERYSASPYVRPMADAPALFARRKDGTEFLVEISLGPVDTPSGALVMAAVRDITARKQLEEERDRFFTLSRDMICIAGFDGYFKRLNPAWEKTLGFTTEELLAVPYLQFVHPDDCEATAAEAAKLATGLETISFENRYRCKDGSYKWLLWGCTPSLDHHLVYAAAHDITERKRTEEALLRAKEEAERASKFKDQFLSMMSHELRTPLNAVLGFSELLADERCGPLNDRQHRYLDHVRTGGQHLLKLINDVLDLSRIEAGRLELAMEVVSVEPVIAEVLESLRPLADKKSLVISRHCDSGLAVHADATRFKQVLLNLLGNAVKFTPSGGRIEVAAQGADGQVRIAVRDTGPGIPLEEQTRIFESFYRLSGAASAAEGTGLGLAIAHRLVSLQGGEMGVESQPGHGACFFFNLRAATGQPVFEKPPAPTPQRGGAEPLVLVVEDDPVTGQLLRSQLACAGFSTVLCDSGEKALRLAAELQPAAITLDILMEPTNGWEVLTRLRANPRTAHIPVVVSTVVDEPGVGMALGADDYLLKPVEKPSLLAAIGRCLGAGGTVRLTRPILVVEDDAATREMLAEMLTGQGFAVAPLPDGNAARRWMAASLPDLVLLDLQLPGVTGFQLLAEWRGNPRTADVPVFILTGKELTPEEERFLRAHAEFLFLKKQPWQTPLLTQLRRVLSPAVVRALSVGRGESP